MTPSKTQTRNAVFFNALSHRRRQMLCEILLMNGPKGMPFGLLQNRSGLKTSTLTHHLRFMDQGGILRRKQKGRETWISVDVAHLGRISTGFGKDAIRTIDKAQSRKPPQTLQI